MPLRPFRTASVVALALLAGLIGLSAAASVELKLKLRAPLVRTAPPERTS